MVHTGRMTDGLTDLKRTHVKRSHAQCCGRDQISLKVIADHHHVFRLDAKQAECMQEDARVRFAGPAVFWRDNG